MKIGHFSKENNISIDTVRHYIDLGLILPDKTRGRYSFDEKCKSDLIQIMNLKNLDFTLNEIRTIFRYKRLGKMSPFQSNQYYKSLYKDKNDEIKHKIQYYQGVKEKLDNEIELLDQNSSNDQIDKQMGIKLDSLSLFYCHLCQKHLKVMDGEIKNNQVLNGILQCNCGEKYYIKNGILCTSNTIDNMQSQSQNKQVNKMINDKLTQFINETTPSILDHMYNELDWLRKKLNFDILKKNIVLELGSGYGLFLRHVYDLLPDNSTYIAIDHQYKYQHLLKSMIETSHNKKNIIFICSDYLSIPIKHHSVDYLIDHLGTSNYSSNHEQFLIDEIKHYLKEYSYLLGSFTVFKSFHHNNMIREELRSNFELTEIKKKLKSLKYKPIQEQISNELAQPGEHEMQFSEEEKVFSYFYYGKRSEGEIKVKN
ncbi:MerR family transcriptional regulator [Chengkuizengella axinellae]|uniref:MerR family transcriptional regulator n=1 Tax=Chengkuizengella axinellae TaxID=3064388 RepID=A0ABT9J4J9_9BACL|nr:MerR family transcriptional regulator [Chengkuizengella sp. 2205SS18-9]MDP5276532.1 MerR family transcriptional regulator [Chengkuizengella sp. 2205SS18-9]